MQKANVIIIINYFCKMKQREFPNTYVIIFFVIILCAIATWFVPGGEYVKNGDAPLSFQQADSVPQTWQVFTALYKGFEKQAGIIVFILIIGGAFWIVNSSKAIDAGIFSFLNWAKGLERNRFLKKIGVNNIIMIFIMLLFSTFGGVFGMSEECIAFVIILVPLSISMGYDSIVGLCLVYVAAHVGFAGAYLNPFTIGVAQGMAHLPLFSGIEYRLLCWVILTTIMIIFVLAYAAKVKKRPQSSVMYNIDSFWRERAQEGSEGVVYYKNKSSVVSFIIATLAIIIFTIRYNSECVISIGEKQIEAAMLLPIVSLLFVLLSVVSLRKSVHFYILNLLCFTIVYLVIGVLCFGWYIPEITALFLSLGLLSGIAAGLSPNNIVKEFLTGAKDIFSAALIVGLASGIIIILQDGKVIDTILNSLASGLGESGKVASLSTMYGIQTLINLLIPSATAKAAITMPIMVPFADIIGLSRQATVLAFQFGDGFTNMITPTSGVLIAALGMAKIPYSKWVKWVWKFVLCLIVVGFLLLLPPIFISLPGF